MQTPPAFKSPLGLSALSVLDPHEVKAFVPFGILNCHDVRNDAKIDVVGVHHAAWASMLPMPQLER
ncbi:hypothetical protein BPOR_0441g00050 [Botrytis porri]|uniref:Uncharacterized protein n=1 Tax=Botrytis porri TaxID=87229 RepID=A0A4Z1KHK8_9HELO|nr:hypothetical protein BPOR_0441g00050 [Botrytis porri]